jgi:hypothetical protein
MSEQATPYTVFSVLIKTAKTVVKYNNVLASVDRSCKCLGV